MAALDAVIADRITGCGPLSEYKLVEAIDVWVGHDRSGGGTPHPQPVRRTRDFTVADTDPEGTAAVYGRLLGPDAAVLKQRVDAMARGVCQDDPRTLSQRRSDAIGASAGLDGAVLWVCEPGLPRRRR